jgi:NAD(P)-dependent dehydrogenase (short-subunit alcohol dehydrogenase family)
VEDRVAIVTGGGSGIGAATTRLLAERGLTVAIVGRGAERLDAVAAEITAAGGTALPVPADLGEASAAQAIVDTVLERTGRLDVIVNNAAAFWLRPFGEYTLEDVDAHLAANVRAPFLLVQAALPALRRSSAPAVVNVSSAAAVMYRPGQAVYGFTKAAIEHMTKQLAFELAPDRIRVNCIRPGPTDTPIHRAVSDPEERLRTLGALTPLGRVGRPEEIAWWIAALIDPQAEWVTGAVIPVDGGRVLGPPEQG